MPQYSQNSGNKPYFKPQLKRLMDQVREVLRYHHHAIRTEEVYTKWILAFIRFHVLQQNINAVTSPLDQLG